jgi:hypothetical protein
MVIRNIWPPIFFSGFHIVPPQRKLQHFYSVPFAVSPMNLDNKTIIEHPV